jgi:uncharacterized membrane protein SpoIIM required for sporulation
MMVGVLFGAVAIGVDEDAKRVLMPFEYLQMDPVERVAKEEQPERNEKLQGIKGQFFAYLMTHNTRVSIFVLALGMTWGIGTLIVQFSNGVMLGAVAADYVLADQTGFLMGWLLPHGVIEIPAILVAGQAGFILAGALIGTGSAVRLRDRLRGINHDVVTLIGGVAIMLVWAGLVEAFFSQYHEPVIPYAVKTAFGIIEFVLLMTFFIVSGRGATQPGNQFRNKGIKGTLSYDAD